MPNDMDHESRPETAAYCRVMVKCNAKRVVKVVEAGASINRIGQMAPMFTAYV